MPAIGDMRATPPLTSVRESVPVASEILQNLSATTAFAFQEPGSMALPPHPSLNSALIGGYFAGKISKAYHAVASRIFPVPALTPLLSPDQQRSQKSEKLLMAEKAIVYSGPVQLLEIDGLMDQRVDADDAANSPLYNPDGDFTRLADIDWSDFSAANLQRILDALSAEILRPLGQAYYAFVGHSRAEILSSPELGSALDTKGNFKAGLANFIKVGSQLVLDRVNGGNSGVGKAYQNSAAFLQAINPFLGLQGVQKALLAFDEVAKKVSSPYEILERSCWTDTLFDQGADPVDRMTALVSLFFSNWGNALALSLDASIHRFNTLATAADLKTEMQKRTALFEVWTTSENPAKRLQAFAGLCASSLAITLKWAVWSEKTKWHHILNDDVEKVLKDAIGPKFKATATEKILAWIAFSLAGMDMFGLAAAVYLYRQYVYAKLGYRWVPSLSRKAWQTLFGKNSAFDGNVSREYLLQLSLYSGKALLSVNSLLATSFLAVSHFFSDQPVTAKALYDESIQAARESPELLNMGISGLAFLMTGAGLAFQLRDTGTVLNRIRKNEPAPANPFNLTNGWQLTSAILGTGGALSNVAAVCYLGSNLNGPAFMFFSGVSGVFMLFQGGIKYKDQIAVGARNFLSRLR